MRILLVPAIGLLALGLSQAPLTAAAADCSQGSDQDKIACLNQAVGELAGKVDQLTAALAAKADSKETLQWNDRIVLRNEDMRIYPRCLENPGPDSQNITDVFANSCARVPAQTWMIAKP